MNSSTGSLFIVSAPSGAGKTSLLKALLDQMDNLLISVSHTTRSKRPGEVDGQNYHFVERPTFEKMVADGIFLEYADVFGNYYGTSKKWVTEQREAGRDVILEIDWQGAQQVRQRIPDTVGIFILPPSVEALESRLKLRQQDDLQVIQKRLDKAKSEMSHYREYDYIVVNDVFEVALAHLISIIKAHRLHVTIQEMRLKGLLNKLTN